MFIIYLLPPSKKNHTIFSFLLKGCINKSSGKVKKNESRKSDSFLKE